MRRRSGSFTRSNGDWRVEGALGDNAGLVEFGEAIGGEAEVLSEDFVGVLAHEGRSLDRNAAFGHAGSPAKESDGAVLVVDIGNASIRRISILRAARAMLWVSAIVRCYFPCALLEGILPRAE